MSWAKVDDQLHSNEKVLECSLAARGLWITCLSWVADKETDGAIPRSVVKLHAAGQAKALSAELVSAGLWVETEGGWAFHDYLTYNPSKADLEAERQKAIERKARWKEKNASGTPAERRSSAVPNAEGTLHPDPDPDPVPNATPVASSSPTPSGGKNRADADSGELENRKSLGLYPAGWEDAEALSPGKLLQRYRETFGPEGEERLAAWISRAKRPVTAQAPYLRPCILEWLRGEMPGEVATPPPQGKPAPTRSVNAAAAARAEALRAEHGSIATALAA
jgi:hypothetical protein